jgi:phosphoribosylformylglycinamidine synthase
VRHLISNELITAAHDISDGGMLVAVAEMALAGNTGALLHASWEGTPEGRRAEIARLFGEDQGRYIVTTELWDSPIDQLAESWGLTAFRIGFTAEDEIYIGDGPGAHNIAEISLADLRAAHESFFPRLMGSELTPEF